MRKSLFLFLFLLPMTGCGYKTWSANVIGWSAAAAPELASVSDSYSTVNKIHMLAQESELVNQYATAGFHPTQIQDFIGGDNLAVRTKAITALMNYATALDQIASGRDITPLTQLQPSTPAVTASELQMDAGITNVNSFAISLLQAKSQRKLSKIIKLADPTIQQFSTLFVDDLTVMKSQADVDYTAAMVNQDQFLIKNKTTMSPTETKNQILILARLVRSKKQSANNFDIAIANIKLFASTHHKLMEKTK